MRQIFAIALAFVSLLSSTQAWMLPLCKAGGAEKAAECACCVEAQACGCVSPSETTPAPQAPVPTSVRHEMPACPWAWLKVLDAALPEAADPMETAWQAGWKYMAHQAPAVPMFILHCSAQC